MTLPDITAVRTYLLALQDRICAALEAEDGVAKFREDVWTRAEGGGGRTRILADGAVFEKAGIAFSHVQGSQLPPAASALRPDVAGLAWEGLGVSLVIHPRNPYLPISHLNVRFFIAGHRDSEKSAASAPGKGEPIWWFGGVMDLTPCYGFEADAVHWHRVARAALAPFGPALHPRFKQACDDYFFIRHRGEQRGIGGLFYDDFDELGFDNCFALTRAVGDAYLPGYLPIIARRKAADYGDRERRFQLYRRGRYAEFNLVWDRGTAFGLQSGGRTESILMSLPPLVRWDYGWEPERGSPEARLSEVFLKPQDWADENFK